MLVEGRRGRGQEEEGEGEKEAPLLLGTSCVPAGTRWGWNPLWLCPKLMSFLGFLDHRHFPMSSPKSQQDRPVTPEADSMAFHEELLERKFHG